MWILLCPVLQTSAKSSCCSQFGTMLHISWLVPARQPANINPTSKDHCMNWTAGAAFPLLKLAMADHHSNSTKHSAFNHLIHFLKHTSLGHRCCCATCLPVRTNLPQIEEEGVHHHLDGDESGHSKFIKIMTMWWGCSHLLVQHTRQSQPCKAYDNLHHQMWI